MTFDTHAMTVEDAHGFARQVAEAAYAVVEDSRVSTTFSLSSPDNQSFPEYTFQVHLRDVIARDRRRPPVGMTRHGDAEVFEGEFVENGHEGGSAFGPGFDEEPPPTRHIASNLAIHSLRALQANQELMISSARQQRDADARELENLRRRIDNLEAARDELVEIREQLLDRSAARELEMTRTLEKDKWVREGLTKILAIIALHSPQILEHLNKSMSPAQVSVMLDIVRSTGVGPLAAAADVMEKGMIANLSGGSPPPPQIQNGSNGHAAQGTAAEVAQAAVSAEDKAKIAFTGELAVFACGVDELLANLGPKLAMVRSALSEDEIKKLDAVTAGLVAGREKWRAVAAAALNGTAQVVATPKGAEAGQDEQKFFDLNIDFWGIVSKEPPVLNKIKKSLPPKALSIVEEMLKDFSFDKADAKN